MKYFEDTFSRILLKKYFLFILIIAASGCTVKYISDYDEATDKAVTELQRKVESCLIQIRRNIADQNTDALKYSNYEKFYDDVRVDISAIRLRAEAQPRNRITLEQIALLDSNLTKLEKAHKEEGFKDVEEITMLRSTFNTQFTAILTLELAKKRGQ